ncbi:hypothetical protein [Mongoliitalea daihaiensis]|uniref:hypothetical protein n=1 Tax=Mongoliitalea daihaiensis TaxID=2782006 RepID=UPI001F371CDB|nr:hypothetical protein [Mongoliitalea daihaiensis]UJP66208.1 hypothetical protein IPZ59_06190 [Mongoliitalea daihaiensis]
MKIKEVIDTKDEALFLKVHVLLNQSNPKWIQPLDKDILDVFNRNKNKQLKGGEAKRWILFDTEDQLIGRIAAFDNPKYKNKGDTIPVGGVGFFDCIDNQQAANVLFDTAKRWLEEKNYQAMDGPINLGDRDKWWGLLVQGFEAPIYAMNYNPPYYQKLWESYGFDVFYNQICWGLSVSSSAHQLSDKFYKAHQKFSSNPDFEVKHLKKKSLSAFAEDLATVYNAAWAQHEGNKEIKPAHALKLLQSMKPVLDEKLIWFAYHQGKPKAMWINLPDVNYFIKDLKGKFGLFEKLQFVLKKLFGKNEKFVGLVFGVVPEFQGSGIDYYMIVEAENQIKPSRSYKHLELYWQGDFNPKMLNISKNLGAKEIRKFITYRNLFDKNAIFERHPIL